MEELTGVRRQLEDSADRRETDDDAMYHLQMAQATLNERYAKLQKKNAELQKRLDQKTMKLVSVLFLSSVCIESHIICTFLLTCFFVFLFLAHLDEQFLQFSGLGFVLLGPFPCV